MPESAKEGATGLPEGSDIGLGPRGREFESLHSDQNPSEIVDFRGVFLFFVYCGAGVKYLLLILKRDKQFLWKWSDSLSYHIYRTLLLNLGYVWG